MTLLIFQTIGAILFPFFMYFTLKNLKNIDYNISEIKKEINKEP
jgi:hypothetical protein